MYVIKNEVSYVAKVEMDAIEGCKILLTDNLALAVATENLSFARLISYALDCAYDDIFDTVWVEDSEYEEALSDFLQHMVNRQQKKEYEVIRDFIQDILKFNPRFCEDLEKMRTSES